ncbi:MAG: hypothetical protein JWP66_1562 [Naasia sp.]|nr:hypothetical protein [Naasia sp.]
MWLLSGAAAIGILVAVPAGDRLPLYPLALAGAVVVTFAIQVFTGEKLGFVTRAMVSTIGALGILAVASAVGALLP